MQDKTQIDREITQAWKKGITVLNDQECMALSQPELLATVLATVDNADNLGWGQKRRLKYNYFRPAEYYAGIVNKCLRNGNSWLDVGGGDRLFPGFPTLERTLASRAAHLVAVDPSANVLKNKFATERIQSSLEDFTTEQRFDIVTARMVLEHVQNPPAFLDSIYHHLKPNGVFIAYTVNLWSFVTCTSRLVPDALHNPIKRLFWGTDAKDTFPTAYKLNTRRALYDATKQAKMDEEFFAYIDDCSILSGFRTLGTLELLAWNVMRFGKIKYPERNIVSVYRKPA